MSSRLNLQTLLEDILESRNVYFQPPESLKINYPAIIYSLNSFLDINANNKLYLSKTSYSITLINKNPDNVFVDKIKQLPYCSFDRSYTSDNLNHYVFTIYY